MPFRNWSRASVVLLASGVLAVLGALIPTDRVDAQANPCYPPPEVYLQPADVTIETGQSARLTVSSNGTVRWFRGNVNDDSTQVGTSAVYETGALSSSQQYWAEISNTCGKIKTRQVTVTVLPPAPEPQTLLNDRYTVQVRYRNYFTNPPTDGWLNGRSLFGSTLAETAVYYFDNPNVIELMVRLSDARPFDNHTHVFLGGVSDVEFFITIRDTQSGIEKTYHKPPNNVNGIVDRSTFPVAASSSTASRAASAAAPNEDGTSTLQLLNDRFRVRMRYKNHFANPPTEGYLLGDSIVSESTTETAVFYFDNREAVEWLVRFSDARPFADRIDLFHGGMSDLEFWIEVTDLLKGVQKEYHIPFNSKQGGVDRGSYTP